MEIISVDDLNCNLNNITHTLSSDGILKQRFFNRGFNNENT